MRVLLELIRIILIFLFLGSLFGYIIGTIYSNYSINMERYGRAANLGIYGIFFVLYRNKWQFLGWYNGKGREKLSPEFSKLLTLCSIILIFSPLILSIILD